MNSQTPHRWIQSTSKQVNSSQERNAFKHQNSFLELVKDYGFRKCHGLKCSPTCDSLSVPQKCHICNILERAMLQLLESTLCNIFSFQEIPVKMFYIKVPAHGISNALMIFFSYVFFVHIHPLLLSTSSLKGSVMVVVWVIYPSHPQNSEWTGMKMDYETLTWLQWSSSLPEITQA